MTNETPKKRERRTFNKTSIHYVDNEKLYEEMVKYVDSYNAAKEADEEPPRFNAYIGECIFKIATRLSTSANFKNYSYRDEMILDGIEDCSKYLQNFNYIDYKSPFTYFTTICYWAFVRRIKAEHKEQYLKWKLTVNSYTFNTLVEQGLEGGHFTSQMVDDYSNDISPAMVDRFESTKKDKEKKTKKKGLELFIGEDDDKQDEQGASDCSTDGGDST